VARRVLRRSMQVTDPAARRGSALEPEPADPLGNRHNVVLHARLGADDVAGFHGVPAVADAYERAALEDQPVLVAVVVVAVEPPARLDSEDSRARDVRPQGTMVRREASNDRQVIHVSGP
jgi:hypothetical protein